MQSRSFSSSSSISPSVFFHRIVRRVLHVVRLDDAYDLMPDELSGGMSRRAAIARAIAGSPEIMFYDSPCSGLDPITSRRLL